MYPVKLLLIAALLCPNPTQSQVTSRLMFDVSRFNTVFKAKYDTYFDCNPNAVYKNINATLPLIINQSANRNTDPKLVLAIVAPEMFRYSAFRNFMETTALETLYIDYGKAAADFSIGYFQMKPSFIEEMEQLDNTLTKYATTSPILLRKERLDRLKSKSWQIKYAISFCELMDKKYAYKQFNTIKDKIAFYATAYNLGINTSENIINQWKDKKVFPYGYQYGNNQCTYSAIAYDIYKHLIYT